MASFLRQVSRTAGRMSMMMSPGTLPLAELRNAPGNVSGHAVFGVPLESLCEFHNGEWKVPGFLTESLEHIRNQGKDQEGIFRLSGIATEITELKARIDLGLPIELSSVSDVHVVSGLFKQYLRELPVPLIPFSFFDIFIAVFNIEDAALREKLTHVLIWGLPGPNQILLRSLITLLKEISDLEEINKMGAHNLAVVFAPTIMRPANEDALAMVSNAQILVDLVSVIITNADLYCKAPPEPRYRAIARAISAHQDDDPESEFLSFQSGDLLWILKEGSSVGWWLGHTFTGSQIKSFPNRAVEIVAEFQEKRPIKTPAPPAAKPPPPGAPKPVAPSQRYDVVVDVCVELCKTIETLHSEISLLRAQNQALASHLSIDLATLPLPAVEPSPQIEHLRSLSATLLKTKAPTKAPPKAPAPQGSSNQQRQMLLSEIQSGPRMARASTTLLCSSSSDSVPVVLSAREARSANSVVSSSSSAPPPPLPSSSPPAAPPVSVANALSVPGAIATQASPRSGPEAAEGTTPRDIRRSRKEPKGSRREPKVAGAKKTKRRSTRKPTSSEGKQQPSSPHPLASSSSEQLASTPIVASDSPMNSSIDDTSSISSAPSTPTPSTPPAVANNEAASSSTTTEEGQEPQRTDSFGSSASPSENVVEEDDQGLILVSCWKCETTSPWDNVSDFVVCTNCGEKSFLDFEEEAEG